MTWLKRGGVMVAAWALGAGGLVPVSAQAPAEQVDAYVLLVRAEQALRNEDHEGAIAAFQGALALYQDLVGDDSDNQRLIEYRIAYCRNQLEQLGATEQPAEHSPSVMVDSIPLPVPVPASVDETEVEKGSPAVDEVDDREELLAQIEGLNATVADLRASTSAMVSRDDMDRAVVAAREEFDAWRTEAEAERSRLNEEIDRLRHQAETLQGERAAWVAQRAEWAAMFAEWEGIEDELMAVEEERDALKVERDALASDLAAAEAAQLTAREESARQARQEDEAKLVELTMERDQALARAAESMADRERREFLEKQVSMLHSELDLFRNRLVTSEQRVRELTRQVLLKTE